MADIEKVIKGLEICVDREPGNYDCYECPYEIDGNYCEINLAKDAIVLLKEYKQLWNSRTKQEPEEMEIEGGGHSWWYVCPECHGAIDSRDRFCRHCGQAVKN